MGKFGSVLVGLVLLAPVACNQSTAPVGREPTVSPPRVAPPVVAPAEEPTSAEPAVLAPVVPDDSKAEARIRALIPRKQALSKEIWRAAGKINDDVQVGTAVNEIHVDEHICFILGSLLGKEKLVKELKIKYEPDLTTATGDNAQELRIMTVSLDNFVANAERILKLSRDERVLEWNLDCVGQQDIPKTAYVAQDGRSTFYTITDDGKVLRVLGDIEAGFAQKMIDAIEANPRVDTVAVGSGGGYVYEAFKAGVYIRQKGLDTVLWNGCYSACPLVLMSGVQRSNWSPYPVLGFHQIFGPDGEAVPSQSQVYKDTYRYLVAMDIDPHYVIQQMWSSPPQGMTVVDGNDDVLCRANIFTWVQRGCTSRSYKSRN